ncbi:MAG: chemotaxis protein CheX [Burkholderiaceae bacterium]|nr:chemotaxis protein CheX [Burkholderiaceae bacterium]
MFQLNELQHDALVELFNQGVGQAAAAMSQIVREEVKMSVPTIAFQTRIEAAQALGDHVARRICAVTQSYDGAFNSEAILMFPEEKSLEIVRLMVGQAMTMEEMSEMEQEAMSEIGNIILNSCMSTLANVAGKELHGSLPMYRVGTSGEILNASGNQWNDTVLTLKIDFDIEKQQINGYVAFLLDVTALNDLQAYLDQYLSGLMT